MTKQTGTLTTIQLGAITAVITPRGNRVVETRPDRRLRLVHGTTRERAVEVARGQLQRRDGQDTFVLDTEEDS
ncbi:MAG: hypothetical protein BWY10_02219 [Chloroflexi bacterium ADurb.Bin180]|nr:MAG: hypothetical protein BWY10_02219 [Chloroflexi bacterium ADurb.Bin180]